MRLPWGTCVEVFDAVNLFGHVGEVEVDRERPDQEDGLVGVGVAEQVGQLPGDVGAVALLAQAAGEHAHLLDAVEQVLAVLAHQGVAELVAEASDVGPECGIGRLVGGGRWRHKNGNLVESTL